MLETTWYYTCTLHQYLAARVVWVSSTKWCTSGWQLFISIDTNIFQCITFGVVCSLSLSLSLPKSVCPGLFHPVGFSCVGPHPKFISGSLLRGLLLALYYRLEALTPGFGGPSILRQEFVAPRRLPSRTFREICDRLHHRICVGSTALGLFSLLL
jgi:hypothetical protein